MDSGGLCQCVEAVIMIDGLVFSISCHIPARVEKSGTGHRLDFRGCSNPPFLATLE
jgi:hypothetical protein